MSDAIEEVAPVHPLVAKMRREKAAALAEADLFADGASFTAEEQAEWDKTSPVDKRFFLELLSNGFQKLPAARTVGVPIKPQNYVRNIKNRFPALCMCVTRMNGESGLAAMRHRSLSSKTEIASKIDQTINTNFLECVTVEQAQDAGVGHLVKKMETQYDEKKQEFVRVVTEWHNVLDYMKEYNKMMGNYAPSQVEQKTQFIGEDGLPTNGSTEITLKIEGLPQAYQQPAEGSQVDAASFILGDGDQDSEISTTQT